MRPRRSHGAGHTGDGLGPYPRVCAGCGKPVRITGDRSLWFHTEVSNGKQERRSYHAEHFPRVATAVAVAGSGGES